MSIKKTSMLAPERHLGKQGPMPEAAISFMITFSEGEVQLEMVAEEPSPLGGGCVYTMTFRTLNLHQAMRIREDLNKAIQLAFDIHFAQPNQGE